MMAQVRDLLTRSTTTCVCDEWLSSMLLCSPTKIDAQKICDHLKELVSLSLQQVHLGEILTVVREAERPASSVAKIKMKAVADMTTTSTSSP
jgi:hypothetical protein